MFPFQKNWLIVAIQNKVLLVLLLTLSTNGQANVVNQQRTLSLSFAQAIDFAQRYDPWLLGNRHQQSELVALSQAKSSLPDSKISLNLANLPIDTADFNQEAMTQLSLGISQVFPRGDSLALNRQHQQIQSEALPFQRQDRREKVAVTVGSLWLDIYNMDKTSELIAQSYVLFEQLLLAAQARYSAGIGSVRQHHIVSAQLELSMLQERLAKVQQHSSALQAQLLPWFVNVDELKNNTQYTPKIESVLMQQALLSVYQASRIVHLVGELPVSMMTNLDGIAAVDYLTADDLYQNFSKHPAVLALDKQLQASDTSVQLAKQRYEVQWGVNARYGYRANDANNQKRSDLFSLGISVDLPLFSNDRNDKYVEASIARSEAMKTDKTLLLRQLFSSYANTKAKLLSVDNRLQLYQQSLIPQANNLAEVALSAYETDDGDFNQVVKAKITALNAEIDQHSLTVQRQKLILTLNYISANSAVLHHNQNSHSRSKK